MPALALLLAMQGWTWSVTPSRPTVGDTVLVQGTIPLSPGWRLRPGRLEPGGAGDIEPLADPTLYREGDTWVVRYAIVSWAPGNHQISLPPAWRLGPDGRADSVPGGLATFTVAAVIPDTLARPGPKPALEPVRRRAASVLPVAGALLGGGVGLVILIGLRRRRPRQLQLPARPRVELEGSGDSWLAAGEPRAVAARAAARLRAAIASAVPEAHQGLSHAECLAVLDRQAPGVHPPLRELTVTLAALEHVEFAGESGAEVGALSRRADALARGFRR